MPEKQKSFVDPENYRTLSEAVTLGEADKRLNAFWEALYALRNEHKIPDLYMIARVNVVTDDGEGPVTMCLHAGNELERESMAAFAWGYERSAARERLINLVRRAEKAGRGET